MTVVFTPQFRLTAENIREVERKDIQVRLQELFRDRKCALEQILNSLESHYNKIAQVRVLRCRLKNNAKFRRRQLPRLRNWNLPS